MQVFVLKGCLKTQFCLILGFTNVMSQSEGVVAIINTLLVLLKPFLVLHLTVYKTIHWLPKRILRT